MLTIIYTLVNKKIVPNILYALVLTSDLLTADDNRQRPATNKNAIDKGNRRPMVKLTCIIHKAPTKD